jgi:hypothetical protein
LFFACSGSICGVYTSIHIEAAIKDGWTVKQAKDFVFLERWTTDYANFYQKWYEVKQTYVKDSTHYWMAKQILNSSIGYYGMKDPVNNGKPLWTAIFILANTCLYHVTMKQALAKANVKQVLYGDTDSVFLLKKDMDKLLSISPEMTHVTKFLGTPRTLVGDLEVDGVERFIVLSKKMYNLNDVKVSHKGHHKRFSKYKYMRSAMHKPRYTYKWTPQRKLKNNQVWISKFIKQKRVMRINIPELKVKCPKCKHFVTNEFRHVLY